MSACLFFLTLSGLAFSVHAAPEMPGLLPTQMVRPLLEQDPSVAAARAGLEAARQEAGILESSPYEWTARLSSQRRTLQEGPAYQEWNAGIERPLRLPGKASADRDIGKATIEEAQARYGEALHEAARDLLSLWLDWLAAERGRELAGVNRQSAQESLSAVEKRLRAGDASQLDARLAQAELAEQQRMENDAKTQAAVAWGRLHARFPGLGQEVKTWPTPVPLTQNTAFWRERILAENDELKTAQAQLQKAQAEAERARADKLPDPTVGIYTASEVGGRERITGLSVSMPIPGGQRGPRAAKSLQLVEVMRQQVESKKRELEAEIANAIASTQGAYTSLQLAEAGAAAMQDNARLMQRAYALGEADLQALLLARRQATAAAQSALAARAGAAKNYYLLLIDAHLVWDLDHE
ncbi:MAG: TolC family protein [Hydrogenophilales bacterium]|nr:TolC family protein [Hydrogenophilales bacterium]